MKISSEIASKIIEEVNDGNIFSVDFVKKSGELRHMVCRKQVKKHLKGGTLKYNPKEKRLVCVFDMQKKDYRMIQLDKIKKIKIHNNAFEVLEESEV